MHVTALKVVHRKSSDFVRRQDREMKKKKRATKLDQPKVQNLDIYQPHSVQEEVRDFGLYGNLRKANTEVRNPLPSPELIDREKHVLEFDKQRRKKPHDVHYKAFYRYLSPALSDHYAVIPKSLPNSASTTGKGTS
ncbi:uncharacterized protein LOC117329161 isoform X1 [Pecten maximus]|uniref:uncharacterized protein LOC117329161 isoform X1 n=2 Tax=Pecten maximus TaxID=6579 RepID=UPI001458B897|nr:uncharacterized protein LOC117329161 isoform X1 [Pecten maximus]